MRDVAVVVIDGHNIDLYPDAEGAAREIEVYDAKQLDYLGADGTVYEATVEGHEWGTVTLHRTQNNRLDDLVRLLRSEAEDRGLSLASDIPADPEAIWGAVLAAQREQQVRSRSQRRRWWKRRAKVARRKNRPGTDCPPIATTPSRQMSAHSRATVSAWLRLKSRSVNFRTDRSRAQMAPCTAERPRVTWLTASCPRYQKADVDAWLKRAVA
jgi:hypothetical protein